MGVITAKDLRYSYSWTAIPSDNPKETGSPDNKLLNRDEGYEMLYFINNFCVLTNLTTKDDALKTETMIKEHLPSNIRSQANVRAWLVENWKKY
ncbi:hypothetical protein HBA12_03365 [Tenacibaculum mesophilum]|uniref:hypothetical protein n=1 Tax=Tenacibaculum mesophilum TaxID=104268 RepID=UPI001430670D|nr:hypothetical protein [Tenacibaculum mesophilum]KAF9659299.1 hypothetical protein HBA12_03365 [Tenacibaculum mesophilum]